MQVAKRLTELRHVVHRLRGVVKEEATRNATRTRRRQLGSNTQLDTTATTTIAASGFEAARESVLFRKAPIALSLLERSVLASNVRQQRLEHRTGKPASTVSQESTPAVRLSSSVLVATPSSSREAAADAHEEKAWLNLAKATSPSSQLQQWNCMKPQQQIECTSLAVLLRELHFLEQERRRLLRDMIRQQQHQCSRTAHAVAHARVAVTNARRRAKKITPTLRSESLSSQGNGAVKEVSAELLTRLESEQQHHEERARTAKEDLKLLRNSLIARPYLTARLWRMVLQPAAWLGAVRQQGQLLASVSTGQRAETMLLDMLLDISSLSLGTLGDYVHGASINRAAPRFVVSLPSRGYRQRRSISSSNTNSSTTPFVTYCEGSGAGNGTTAMQLTTNTQDTRSDDPLEDMMIEGYASTSFLSIDTREKEEEGGSGGALAKAAVTTASAKRRNHAQLRWLPSHTSNVLPLAIETLALASFALPELQIQALVEAERATEMLSLLVTLQKLATTTLALGAGAPQHLVDSQDVHRVLSRLEAVLLRAGQEVKAALVAKLTHTGKSQQGSGYFHHTSPAIAARSLLELDSLHLLHPHERKSLVIVDALIIAIYPQLRSNTYDAMLAQTRQSSLLAFATRGHRAKLLQSQRSVAGAEAYLVNTVVQQARLNQRRIAAALRERHLTDFHLRLVTELGAKLQPHELVSLFQLFALSACEPTGRGAMPVRASRALTASIFTAEALLASEALRAEAPKGNAAAEGGGEEGVVTPPTMPSSSFIRMEELTRLWTTLTVLWPLIDTRRELLYQQQQHHRGGRRGGGHSTTTTTDSRSETAIIGFLTETVLHCINGVMAERLQTLDEKRTTRGQGSHRTGGNSGARSTPLSPRDMVAISTALSEWSGGVSSAKGGPAGRPKMLQQQALITGKLMRELLMHDHELWRCVRSCEPQGREQFQSHVVDCLQSLGLLDTTTSDALERVCYGSM